MKTNRDKTLANVTVGPAGKKGKGTFALKDFQEGEVILVMDLSENTRVVTESDIPNLGDDGDHLEYIGNGRYVIEYAGTGMLNHSCSPNAYFEFEVLTERQVLALRAIKAGEEITFDNTLCAVDQMEGRWPWTLECWCGNADCRGLVVGDFFKMPPDWQRRNLRYLPTWVKIHYHDRLSQLSGKSRW
jgi:uncharacterized protein